MAWPTVELGWSWAVYLLTSHSKNLPSPVCNPFSDTRVMGLSVRLQFGCRNDSRYPGPGVILLHPSCHFGISFSQSAGSCPNFSAICAAANFIASSLFFPFIKT